MPNSGACGWCGEERWERGLLSAAEMMYGTRERFTIDRCLACGSLALADPPADLAPHYPADYYSYRSRATAFDAGRRGPLLRPLTGALLRAPVPAVDLALRRVPLWGAPIRWLAGRGVRPSGRVLDVGSGDGYVIKRMALWGFEDLLGIDPYLDGEIEGPPVTVRRAELAEIEGSWEVVMANHVLEHVRNPGEILNAMASRLSPGGTIVVRVPLADSPIAARYGHDWVALDVPRHLTVPTAAGVRRAVERAGLRLVREFRDGAGFAFWASEQYARGVPLEGGPTEAGIVDAGLFSRGQLRRWNREARRLNRRGEGDSGCFVIAG